MLQLEYHIFSVIGEREINEDVTGVSVEADRACFVVNDGLGGHDLGEVASKLVANTVLESFRQATDLTSFFTDSYTRAEQLLEQKQRESGRKNVMKTTSLTLIIDAGRAQWCHIGDSRLYRFEKGKLLGRTLDHSVPQMLVAAGNLREREIRFHEDRSRLLRVMGGKWDGFAPEISDVWQVKSGVSFLLCTDGFWEWIDEKQMSRCLKKSSSVQEWTENMGIYVLEQGKGKHMDNASAIGIWVR